MSYLNVPLGEVLISRKGKKPKLLLKNQNSGTVPYIDIKAFEKSEYRQFVNPTDGVLTKEGDLVMVWDGARAGLVGQTPEGVLGSTLMKLEVPLVPSKLVKYFFDSKFTEINTKTKGVGIPHVNPYFLESLPFPIIGKATSVQLLNKIEELFSEIDAGTEALKRVEANLKRYRASVLKAACEGKLVPTEAELAKKEGREYEPASVLLERILKERREKWQKENPGKKYKEPKAPDTKDLPELPEGWVWASMDQLSEISGGLTLNASQRTSGKSYPYLRVANVYANQLNLEEIKHVNVTESELKRVLLQKDDLLIVEGNGSQDQIGRVAVWDGSIVNCVHQNHLIKARCIATLAPYLLNYLLSPGGRSEILKVASSTSGLYTLSLSKIAAISVPLPPESEISRIILELDREESVFLKISEMISLKSSTCNYLKQSLLKKAFSGKLVPQDPNDEPASVLFERIKEERAKREADENTKKQTITRKPKAKKKTS